MQSEYRKGSTEALPDRNYIGNIFQICFLHATCTANGEEILPNKKDFHAVECVEEKTRRCAGGEADCSYVEQKEICAVKKFPWLTFAC